MDYYKCRVYYPRANKILPLSGIAFRLRQIKLSDCFRQLNRCVDYSFLASYVAYSQSNNNEVKIIARYFLQTDNRRAKLIAYYCYCLFIILFYL